MTCSEFVEWLSSQFDPSADDQSPLLKRMLTDESLLCGLGVQMIDLDARVLFLCSDGLLESSVTIWSDAISRDVGDLDFAWLFYQGDVSENIRDVSHGRLSMFIKQCARQRDVMDANVRTLTNWQEKLSEERDT